MSRLKAFKRFKILIAALLVMLFGVSGVVYGLLKKDTESKLNNIFRIQSSVILIVMFTVLGYHQFAQYHFFIKRRIAHAKSLEEKLTAFELASFAWIYTIITLNFVCDGWTVLGTIHRYIEDSLMLSARDRQRPKLP